MDEYAMGQLSLQAATTPAAAPPPAPSTTLALAPRVHAAQQEKPLQGETLAPHLESSPACH